MIGIRNFGWRLGNQMFQIATGFALAKRKEQEVSVPADWAYANLFEGEFKPGAINGPVSEWNENGFHYTEIPITSNIINGYFQSEKYFSDFEDEVKALFKIKQGIINDLSDKHKELFDKGVPTVAVHLRRGDYLQHPNHHPVMDLNYYMKAMKKFPKDAIFLVFSDDTEWCKANFPGIGEKFFIIEGQTDVEDFALQTMCDHNVIANSSYSWWAAWLNDSPEKIVVAPEKWFGPAYANWKTDDLYCEGWIKI